MAIVTKEMVPGLIRNGGSARRNEESKPAFKVGQAVRVKNMHPSTHTRLPRYVRGKVGKIAIDHGVFLFPDTSAYLSGERPQHVYSITFAARELWGDQVPVRDTIRVDLWDDYIEPA